MKTPTKEETTQLSGLSDFELKLDELSDKIKVTKSSLECIGLLRSAIEAYHSEKLPEELKKFFAYFHASDEGAEEIVREYLKPKDSIFQTSPTVLDQQDNK